MFRTQIVVSNDTDLVAKTFRDRFNTLYPPFSNREKHALGRGCGIVGGKEVNAHAV